MAVQEVQIECHIEQRRTASNTVEMSLEFVPSYRFINNTRSETKFDDVNWAFFYADLFKGGAKQYAKTPTSFCSAST